MSKVKIQGNASGTGTLTISAPNTNTDRTLTLPDGAGEILLSDGDGSNLTGIAGVSDAFKLRLSSNQAPVATGGQRKINVNTADIDTGSNCDTSNYKYVAPSDGTYFLGGFVWTDNYNAGATDVEVSTFVNGSNPNIWGVTSRNANEGYTGVRTSGLVNLSANDYVELYMYHNHGYDITVFANSVLWGFKLL